MISANHKIPCWKSCDSYNCAVEFLQTTYTRTNLNDLSYVIIKVRLPISLQAEIKISYCEKQLQMRRVDMKLRGPVKRANKRSNDQNESQQRQKGSASRPNF